MSKKEVERFLIAGGNDKKMRMRYDLLEPIVDFVGLATLEEYDFTSEELMGVLKESGDTFESSGNPRKRDIWWF